jgi:hypothetical protein
VTLTIFIPQDTTAVAVGANRVAAAFLERAKALDVDLQIVRKAPLDLNPWSKLRGARTVLHLARSTSRTCRA